MSKRTLVWIVVALVALLSAAGLAWSMFGTSRLVFTEGDIQVRLNQQLPKTVREMTIEHVGVRLANNRLALYVVAFGAGMYSIDALWITRAVFLAASSLTSRCRVDRDGW